MYDFNNFKDYKTMQNKITLFRRKTISKNRDFINSVQISKSIKIIKK